MSQLQRFVRPPELDDPVAAMLAKHLAMDLLPEGELLDHLDLDRTELARLRAEPGFQAAVRREKARLLTIEGRREVADWKQALTENQYWDRLMAIGMSETSSATALIEGMKVTKRPPAREAAGAGGPGGPQFIVNISVPGEQPMRMTTTVVNQEIGA